MLTALRRTARAKKRHRQALQVRASWVARHLHLPDNVDRVLLPGLCSGDLTLVAVGTDVRVERGPKDLRDLPEFFGAGKKDADYGKFDIEILAEVNHAPRVPPAELVAQAQRLHQDGADVIDVGCDPGETWNGLADAVRALRQEGLRVSIDTFNPSEAMAGAEAGAELVLSVNNTNREAARKWGCEVVAVPDTPGTLESLDDTIAFLQDAAIPFASTRSLNRSALVSPAPSAII